MNPILAALAVDAVFDSDLCQDGLITFDAQAPLPVRIKPDNGDVAFQMAEVSITARAMMFKLRVSECPNNPKGAVINFSEPSDTRRFRVTSASRKDNARLEWHCATSLVKP